MKNTEKFKVKNRNYNNWEDVFNDSQPITVETLNTGRIICKVSGLMNLSNNNNNNLFSKKSIAEIPVLAHIIRHEKFGTFLIDTGFDSSFHNKIGGNYKGVLKKKFFKNNYIQEYKEDGIDYQTKDIKIDGVFLTHFHEHVSGAESLSNEIPFIFGKGEKEINFFPIVYSKFLSEKHDKQFFDFDNAVDMPIIGKCIDVFGDASFWAISTPGHTKGHVSYLINGKDGQVLIAGDACILKVAYENKIEPGTFSEDISLGRTTFLKMCDFAENYKNLKIIFGHETEEHTVTYL